MSAPVAVVEHLRAGRHAQDRRPRRRGRTCPCSRPPAPVGRLELALVAEIEQRREPLVDDQHDAAAVAAVAAGGAALGDELLAPKRDRALAAVARAHADDDLIDEVHGRCPCLRPDRAGRVRRRPRREPARPSTMLTIVRGPGLDVLHLAVLEREQREVTSHADVAARRGRPCRPGGRECCRRARSARRGA